MGPDQKTLDRLMKISRGNRTLFKFSNVKGNRESRSKNYVNIKITKDITFTEPLGLSLSSSPKDQLRHYTMLCPLQSVIPDKSLLFDNISLGNSLHENGMTITHLQIEFELSSPKLAMVEKLPKQQYIEIRHIPFQNLNILLLW